MMLTLFHQYKDSNRITEAVLVGCNLFNRNSSREDVFTEYFDLLCSLAENLPSLAERKDFAGQASVALAFFSENAEISESVVDHINACEQRLEAISASIAEVEQKQTEDRAAKIAAHNSSCIKELYDLKNALQSVSGQEQFDKILLQISEIDQKIDKAALTAEQAAHYDTLSKSCTDLISVKMRELEYRRNIAYNKQAVDAYDDAFKKFRSDEAKYKNQTQLFGLVSATLFAYDASRLFQETLVYYNHIYSYIFNKLDNDGKRALTRFSIECERKLR